MADGSTMTKGFYMTLMIGPVVPIPVSREILDALTSIRVTTTTDGPSTFQLSFTLSTKSPLHVLFLLAGGTPIPLVRVVIAMTVNGTPDVIMDGVMTNHEVSPGKGPGQSTLTITGEDLTKVMDYEDFSGIPYIAAPDFARVDLILLKYIFLGIVPLVIPSVFLDVPLPTEQIPAQQGTDLNYINDLAKEAGYVFYIDPGPIPGTSVAYWGPEIKVGVPQPALNTNMDAYTNVESLTFTYNSESKNLPAVWLQNKESKLVFPVPIPDITPLSPPLGLLKPFPKAIKPIQCTAKLNPIQALMIGMAEAAKTADVVSGSGTLDVLRYGRILKARKLVGVRGAGLAFDGLYYVKSVTHNIKRGEYKQDFTLSRNGLVSTFSKVPV